MYDTTILDLVKPLSACLKKTIKAKIYGKGMELPLRGPVEKM
jgi:hypothetical protein